jgi:hypothetical protein
MGVGWLPRWMEFGVVGSQELLMFPRGFVFRVVIPLDLVEPSSLVGVTRSCWSRTLMGYALYVKSGSNGMVSSIKTSIGGFSHLLSWET